MGFRFLEKDGQETLGLQHLLAQVLDLGGPSPSLGTQRVHLCTKIQAGSNSQ